MQIKYSGDKMSLKAQIMADIKEAMKNKEQVRLGTLRFLNSAIKNKEIEVRPNEISEDDILSVIKKAVKQRKESIDQYQKAERQDLADKEKSELDVLSVYLPEQMSREKVEEIVTAVIKDLGADSMKMMGAVMKETLTRCGGAADNKVVSEVVKAQLS